MKTAVNTKAQKNIEDFVIVSPSDLKSALLETKATGKIYITVMYERFMALKMGRDGRIKKASRARQALKSKDEHITIVLTPQLVRRALIVADEAIKNYGEENALLIIFKKQIDEDNAKYSVEILNSIQDDELFRRIKEILEEPKT